jgi:hypothetical protein
MLDRRFHPAADSSASFDWRYAPLRMTRKLDYRSGNRALPPRDPPNRVPGPADDDR